MSLSMKRCVLLFLACFAWHAAAQMAPDPGAPSFACAKARGRVEKLVCAEPRLAALDRRVADLFAIAQAQALDAGDAKRAQRRWLGDRNDCKDSACAEERYRQRIEQLVTETGRFDASESAAICEPFLDTESRAQALAATAGAQDINNDGSAERASTCAGGTANIPCVAYLDQDGKPLQITTRGFEWLTYGSFGRAPFRAGGRTFTYHARDAALEQPAYISYVTPANVEMRVCDFDTVVGSAVLEGSAEVCTAIEAEDERIETFEWMAISDTAPFAVDRRDAQPRALGKVDVDNDGLEENLIEYAYSSGAGSGCEINYFELLTDDGQTRANDSNAAAVRALQGLRDDGVDGRSCGLIVNRLFRFGDEVFFESNAGNAAGLPHEVKSLQGVAVVPTCAFEREVRTTIKSLN